MDVVFVYGTLRPGHDGPMAHWLAKVADHLGPATATGSLYRIDDYPGFVPGPAAHVTGYLFALSDPATQWAILDDHEQCSDDFPRPHEYRREPIIVQAPTGPVEAWVYVYALDVADLERIPGGDFLGD